MKNASYKLVLLLVALYCLSAAPSQAGVLQGKTLFHCGFSHASNDDPILYPGQPGLAHRHAFFGNTSTNASTTTGSLLNAPTTCFARDNHTAMWTPTAIFPDGTEFLPTKVGFYYGAFGKWSEAIAGGRISPFAQGTRYIAGNPKAMTYQSANIVKWGCSARPEVWTRPPTSTECAGMSMRMLIFTPSCWDGEHLGTPTGTGNVVYPLSIMVDGVFRKGCPPAHPIAIPELQFEVSFPSAMTPRLNEAWRLSSDMPGAQKGASAHMDYWSAWLGAGEQEELTQCINDPLRTSATAPICEIITYAGADNKLFADSRAFPWARPLP